MLHRVLRLKGIVIIIVWYDVCRKYVGLPGLRLVESSAEGMALFNLCAAVVAM